MKKFFILLLLLCVLMGFTSPALAADEIKVFVDNQLLQLEDPPVMQEGRTLAPMRAFFEALGSAVDWDSQTQTAIGRRGNTTVRIPIGSTRPIINNRIEPIDVAAQIIDGRTYIPLRFVGEALGDDVQWFGETRSIAITRLDPSAVPVEEEAERKPAESLSVWMEADREIVPAGGGQKVNVTVTVADNHGYLVEGAIVSFFAEAFEAGERHGQLSHAEVLTDEQGQARSTYTTLAADDQRFVTVKVSAFKDFGDHDFMEFRDLQFVAANETAQVKGVVTDPFTGAPLEGVHIHFGRESIGFVETDAEGRYKATVPTGHYGISFNMEMRDEIAVNLSTPGQTYTVNNNKGILKGVVTGVPAGKEVMAIGPGFSRHSQDNWTLVGEVQSDGSFMMALFPNTYELMIIDPSGPPPFKRGVTVKSGQVTNIGTVSGR